MLIAKDLMTKDPIVLQSNDDPRAILKIFLEKRLTALPVADQGSNILGILSEMNLVKIMVQFAADGKGKKIGNYSSLFLPAIFVTESDNLGNVVKAMVGSSTHRVLVRNKMEKVIGIISPKDLLRVLAGESSSSDE